MSGRESVELEASGRTVTITSPDKVYFSERGETKLDLARYLCAVEEPLLRAIGGRPILMERYPEGASGKSFFQKRVPKSAPDWLTTVVVSTPNGTTSDALVAVDLAHLLWAVNQGCLGFHAWPSRADDVDGADELRIDLDPTPGVTREMVREARAPRRRRCWTSSASSGFPKTTGKNGIHVYVRARAGLRLVRGAAGRGRVRARARTPAPRPADRRLVEGGARPARVRRLQPERAAQDRLLGLGRARAHGGAGLDAVRLGRARRTSTSTR